MPKIPEPYHLNDQEALIEYVRSTDPDHAYPEHNRIWFNMTNGYNYRWNGIDLLYHRFGNRKPGLFD